MLNRMTYKTQSNKLSTRFGSLPQKAVDEAIEQHRLNGHAIAQSDKYGNVIEIQPEDITPLTEKLEQRKHKPSKAS
jgi:hypothetical protein